MSEETKNSAEIFNVTDAKNEAYLAWEASEGDEELSAQFRALSEREMGLGLAKRLVGELEQAQTRDDVIELGQKLDQEKHAIELTRKGINPKTHAEFPREITPEQAVQIAVQEAIKAQSLLTADKEGQTSGYDSRHRMVAKTLVEELLKKNQLGDIFKEAGVETRCGGRGV